MNLQDLIATLTSYWAERGCLIHQPWDAEVGAGTMHPETFFRVLRPDAVARGLRPAIAPPGRRPVRREPESPLQAPSIPGDPQAVARPTCRTSTSTSLERIGIDPARHDVRFEEDNWESPTLGAWGIGWQVLLDGQEITQFTYFQQAGGIELAPISAEITYGLERIAMYLQDVESAYDLAWAPGVPYRDVRHEEEYQLRATRSRTPTWNCSAERSTRRWRKEPARSARGRASYLPAYDWCLKASHAFNVLDARGAISVSQRAAMILSIRKLACAVAAAYVAPNRNRSRPVAEFLLEIGCEEIPASWLADLEKQFARGVSKALQGAGLGPSELVSAATPRRLVVGAQVAARQEDRETSVFGPSLKQARDGAGKWTRRRSASPRRTASRPRTLQPAPKDPAKPDEQSLLFVQKVAGPATAAAVLPGLLGADPARHRVSQANELGRVARRRQGRLRLRPARFAGSWRCSTARCCRSRSSSIVEGAKGEPP